MSFFRRFMFPGTTNANNNNSMKRWWRFQQTLNKKRWFELDREYNGPITLWDFSRMEDAQDAALVDESSKRGGWRISDDSVIGGYSRATMELVQTPQDYQRIIRGESSLSMIDPSTIQEIGRSKVDRAKQEETVDGSDGNESDKEMDATIKESSFTPFIRWKGTIDTQINKDFAGNLEETGKNVKRSGFCTIRSPDFAFGGIDLGGRYNGLEFTCRSDGRPYSVNLRCESFIQDDLFQCFISIPPTIKDVDACTPPGNQDNGGSFDQVVLLFQHFIATKGGRVRATQRVLDNSIKIISIGFTLMDGVEGDFQFDLARIRAVNYDERGVIGEAD